MFRFYLSFERRNIPCNEWGYEPFPVSGSLCDFVEASHSVLFFVPLLFHGNKSLLSISCNHLCVYLWETTTAKKWWRQAAKRDRYALPSGAVSAAAVVAIIIAIIVVCVCVCVKSDRKANNLLPPTLLSPSSRSSSSHSRRSYIPGNRTVSQSNRIPRLLPPSKRSNHRTSWPISTWPAPHRLVVWQSEEGEKHPPTPPVLQTRYPVRSFHACLSDFLSLSHRRLSQHHL